MNYLLLIIYSVIIVLASAMGGTLPRLFRFTHRRIQMTLSLVSGVMLGVAFLHLLPHSIVILNNDLRTSLGATLTGLLAMFLLIRTFHFHQHDVAADDLHLHGHDCCDHGTGADASVVNDLSELPLVGSDELCVPSTNTVAAHNRDLSWMGLTVGLALHTLIDGLALAAAYSSERTHTGLAAFGTFLAIVLHKPLDAMTITSLMSARKIPESRQMVVNLVFALMCPLGAILFALSFDQMEIFGQWALGVTLAFSAGVFLCISLGDLLPEVHFHSHDRVWLSLMLLVGVLIAWLIEVLTGHQHTLPG